MDHLIATTTELADVCGRLAKHPVITVDTGGAVTIRAVSPSCVQPYAWEDKREWYDPTKNVANFVLIHFPQEKGKTSVDADAFLTKRGLVLRALNNYGLPHSLRMTIGTEEANRLVVDVDERRP